MYLLLAIMAGSFAALGSVCSKLSFHLLDFDQLISVSLFLVCMLSMILCNLIGLFLYTKSLRQIDSTVVATLTTTASNYTLSGIFGVWLFGESLSMDWLIGSVFIMIGLFLMSSKTSNQDDDDNVDDNTMKNK